MNTPTLNDLASKVKIFPIADAEGFVDYDERNGYGGGTVLVFEKCVMWNIEDVQEANVDRFMAEYYEWAKNDE